MGYLTKDYARTACFMQDVGNYLISDFDWSFVAARRVVRSNQSGITARRNRGWTARQIAQWLERAFS